MLANLIRGARSHAASRLTEPWAHALEQARGLAAAGDLTGAELELRRVLRTVAPSAEGRCLLGSILGASGRLNEARDELEHALRLDPGNATALAELGNVFRLSGRIIDAERCYRRSLEIDPSVRSARLSLAQIDAHLGRDEMAKRALILLLEPPAFAPALQVLVSLLDRHGGVSEAKQVCMDVLSREPGHGSAHAAFGFLLLKRDLKPKAALAHFERALQAGYRDEDVLANRGIALQDLGDLDGAIESYNAALQLQPNYHVARFHRALAFLLRGEFGRAWPDYELRLASEEVDPPPRALPRWNGEELADSTLLVYGEQGIGDEMMFASCLPDLLRKCPKVVLACASKLEPILRRSFPGIEVVSLDRTRQPGASPIVDQANVMSAIGSLPLHFRSSPADFPRHVGYLRADPALVAHYRERLRAVGSGPKVGISWRGGTRRSRQELRTLDRDQFTAILDSSAHHFVNLQYDSTADEPGIATAIASGRLTHWPEALSDYEHTAALVCALDVVVSVCTAVIHLAGALGRPVWVMAPFSPEWRYGIAGEAMPWYPSASVIRQRAPGDWGPVVAEVRTRLQALPA